MASSSTIVTLPQMVDLALAGPEVGTVNFNILHALLHIIIQQQQMLALKVEFRGDESTRVQNLMNTSKKGPTLTLSEYAVQGQKGKGGGKSAEEGETVVVVEPNQDGIDTPHLTVAVDRNFFENIERDVGIMKLQIKELTDLPSNQGLMEALQSEKTTPVLDMFQILNLKKRVDGVEVGINKLGSIFEDLAKGGTLTNALNEYNKTYVDDGRGTFGGGGTESMRYTSITGSVATTGAGGGGGGVPGDLKDILEDLKNRLNYLETDGLLSMFKAREAEIIGFLKEAGLGGMSNEKAKEIDDKFKECMDRIASLDCMFNNQFEVFHNQLCDLEKELGVILERLNSRSEEYGFGGPLDESALTELFEKISKIEKDIEDLAEKNVEMIRDKEDREAYINTLVEQIEFLRNIKANREDMEDALAEKADVCAVNKKVNYDQFEQAYDELTRNIDETLAKLTQQEALWQQTLDEIQNEIANKLDKADLRPLKDYVNAKLKQLQDRLKALAALKRDAEAAGTKTKFLRNVNCISCDKDVIMRKELDTSLFPPKPGLPPTKSMAPYLAYELDALRKQQRCMPHGRDMNQFENVMNSTRKQDKGDHICNRYCGGSHTVTTPQQRVTRMGHFIQQWGPEGLSEEHHIKGTDGQFYKGSEVKPPTDENVPDDAFRTRPSVMVQGDILTARTNLKSARISEAEMHVTEPEAQEKTRKPSVETTEKRGSKSTPRGSKELPSPGPRGSKEGKRPSKGSKEEAEAGGGSKRSSKGSKGPEEAQTPQEEGGSPPEEESAPPPAEAEAEEGADEAAQE